MKTQRIFRILIALVLAVTTFGLYGIVVPPGAALAAPNEINGTVFLDFNGNGQRGASDTGVAGVTVTAYDTGKSKSTVRTPGLMEHTPCRYQTAPKCAWNLPVFPLTCDRELWGQILQPRCVRHQPSGHREHGPSQSRRLLPGRPLPGYPLLLQR